MDATLDVLVDVKLLSTVPKDVLRVEMLKCRQELLNFSSEKSVFK
jgi:uncharacterized protein YfaA (DUF2138 family)